MNEAPSGWTVYRLDFSDGSAYVGRTKRSVLKRIAVHLLDGANVQERIAAGLTMRVSLVATGLDDASAESVEHDAIVRLDKPINRQGARGSAPAVVLPHTEAAKLAAAKLVHVPYHAPAA